MKGQILILHEDDLFIVYVQLHRPITEFFNNVDSCYIHVNRVVGEYMSHLLRFRYTAYTLHSQGRI